MTLDPADFTTEIDNPYFPLEPGSRAVFREGDQQVVIRVTNDTRKIEGITARVVRDTVTENGDLVEDTFDWYAQDSAGNVWYMGEDTTEYENGKPKTRRAPGRRAWTVPSRESSCRPTRAPAWRIARSTTRVRPRIAPRWSASTRR